MPSVLYLRLLVILRNFIVAFYKHVCYAYLKKNKPRKQNAEVTLMKIILAAIFTILFLPLGIIFELMKEYM